MAPVADTHDTWALTESDVVYLEAHGVHCPYNAWQVINQAHEAKRVDDADRRANQYDPTAPRLTQQLQMLAGVCQKVTVSFKNRMSFKRLYRSAYLQGKFNPAVANPARLNPAA